MQRARISDLTPHDMRHTCATWLLRAGVLEQIKDEMMGHASPRMGRRYAHVPVPELIEAINRLPWFGMPAAAAEENPGNFATVPVSLWQTN
jgi:integrase